MIQNAPRRLRRTRLVCVVLLLNIFLLITLAGAAFIYGWTRFARSLPELHGWHLEAPASEFIAADAIPGYTLDDYLAQEARVFDELNALVDDWSPTEGIEFSRFRADSRCNPATILDRNWNRSLVMKAKSPVGGALLVHGLSDAPYSLREIGLHLHDQGWTVIWLRVPGHGTCPKALAEVSWRDWTAAVRVAARGLKAMLPADAPMTLFGFSNGGALSVEYAAAAVEDTTLPRPDALVLFSPMIGISPMAPIAAAYPIVGRVSGLEKVAWSSIETEVDPFKYSSWPMNASVQAWRMTHQVETDLERLDRAGRIGDMPPILTFQSAVDATVVVPELIKRLYDRLGSSSDLVLFDVNRRGIDTGLIKPAYAASFVPLLLGGTHSFGLTVITNIDPNADDVVERRIMHDGKHDSSLDVEWPHQIFSLSHVAVPISQNDPVYGDAQATLATGIPLGSLNLRGESGVLRISNSLMLRQRFNPFHAYILARTDAWLGDHLPSIAAP